MQALDSIFSGAIDPVCKMTVSRETPPGGTADYEGETYYFCAPGCREEFTARPEQYV